MIEVHPEGCIYELNVGYNSKLEGYTTLMSDYTEVIRNRLAAQNYRKG
jgi:hypothetical protein